MDSFFAAAFSSREVTRVLGRELREFSLWHSAVLELAESPFVCPGKPITTPELLLAVEICAMEPTPGRLQVPRLRSGVVWYWWRMRRWARKGMAAKRRKGRKKGEEEAVDPLLVEAGRFQSYLREHCAGPRMMESPGSGMICTQWQLFLVARLMMAGVTEDRAWRMSPGRAKWMSAAIAEASGQEVQVISDGLAKQLREAGHCVPEWE